MREKSHCARWAPSILLLCIAATSCSDPASKENPDASTSSMDTGTDTSDVDATPDGGGSTDVGTDMGPVDMGPVDVGVFQGSLSGSWRGDFTAEVSPGNTYWIELVLDDQDGMVSGTFTTQNGREATFVGMLEGSTLTSDATYVDDCTGTGTSVMEIAPSGNSMSGTYTSDDCFGQYGGDMELTRQP